jgi:class 3 adenylate cyclase
MADLLDLLTRFGLGRHHDAFVANGVDVDVVASLSEGELAELGLSIGDRKRIARLVASLAGDSPDAPSRRMATPAAHPGAGAQEAQIRQMTVAFIDLTGSTRIAEALDVEDYHAVLAAFRDRCAEAVRDHGGSPARYVGDAMLAGFGYPVASEDDAARGVAAMLQAVADVGRLTGPHGRLAARAGVATGSVMTSDAGDEGPSGLGPVIGAPLNLAARLEAEAAPGEVLIDDATRSLLGDSVALVDLGRREVRGFSEPVRVWRAEVRVAEQNGGGEAHHSIPLIGRDEQLGLLAARWRDCGRRGAMVLLSGEAGVGKSRLLAEFAQREGIPDERNLRAECSPALSQRPLHPFARLFEAKADLNGEREPAKRLATLRRWADQTLGVPPGVADAIAVVAGATPETSAGMPLSQEALFGAILSVLGAISGSRPALLVIEDLHWADPSTVDFLELLASDISGRRLMVVGTHRVEFRPPALGHHNVSAISLSRLDETAARTILSFVDAQGALSGAEKSEILARGEGVPLFIEEMAKAALESRAAPGPEMGRATPRGLPTTIAGSLLARLDRVSGVYRVAPVGAAIGRTFSLDLLLPAAAITAEEAGPILDKLVTANLLVRFGAGPLTRYRFKHALIQDAAYETMPKRRRIEVHRRIADLLAGARVGGPDAGSETLALHYSRAEIWDKAREAWRAAAEASIARFANAEAIANLRAALDANARLEAGAERDRREIALRERLMAPLGLTAWGSPAIDENLVALSALYERTGDRSALFQTLVGQCGAGIIRGEILRALNIAGQLPRVAAALAQPEEAVLSIHYRAMCLFFLGRFDEAIEGFEAEIAAYDPRMLPAIQRLYVADPGVVARAMRVWAALLSRGAEAAAAVYDDALASFSHHPERFTRAYGFGILAVYHQHRGDAAMTVEFARQSLAMSRDGTETRVPYWAAWSQIFGGWGVAMSGGAHEGMEMLTAGLSDYAALGARQILPYGHALLAEARLASGDPRGAALAIEAAEDARRKIDVCIFDATIARVRKAVLAEAVD